MIDVYLSFKDGPAGQILHEWWCGLTRGDQAIMRRCTSAEEIALTAAFHKLRIRLSGLKVDPRRLALVAGLSVHIKRDISTYRIAEQMAIPRAGTTREPVSDLRFRRLLVIEDRNELYRSMIRIIHKLSGEVNLLSLADSVYWWNIFVKQQFASDYYEHL